MSAAESLYSGFCGRFFVQFIVAKSITSSEMLLTYSGIIIILSLERKTIFTDEDRTGR